MSAIQDLYRTLEARLTSIGVDTETIEQSPRSTIVPKHIDVDTASERAMLVLDELGAGPMERKLELRGTIGEGGMGIVRLGVQPGLGREVAVKTLKSEHKSDRTVLKLLREAWVTGALEHPNIVPVYDIAVDEGGAPLIVLKKIEGVDWGTLMHDAATLRTRFGVDDPLEWNLRILLSVCNAVRFAHSRKVLHRDLKPENVMIGQFGEVYLVDWGIAVSLEDDGSGRLPLASEATEIAGTPVYMAPEMLGGAKSRLSERTDVYLLGSILTEIATGSPPHQGETFMQIVASITASEPSLPESVPDELEAIIRRAMDPDPDARFENAEQLRLAVQAFLKHRDAARLAEHAERRMEELLMLIAKHDERANPHDREAIYHVFGECRFAFQHALEAWPGNEAARRALDRTVIAMVEHELALNQPEGARTLLSDMTEVPKELAQRVGEAARVKAAEESALRRLQAEHDPSRGRKTRFFIAIVICLLGTVSPLVGIDPIFHESENSLRAKLAGLVTSVGVSLLMIGLGYWGRVSMFRTAINRQIIIGGLAALGGQAIVRIVTLVSGDSLAVTYQHVFLVWAAVGAMVSSTVDWRMLLGTAGYLSAYALVPFVDYENVRYLLAAAHSVLLVNVLLLWARPRVSVREASQPAD